MTANDDVVVVWGDIVLGLVQTRLLFDLRDPRLAAFVVEIFIDLEV